jgi:hypothetical protein
VLRTQTALWAIDLVNHCVKTTVTLLRGNLADTAAEHTRKRIMQHAWKLSTEALAEPNPTAENTAPADKQDEIRDLKRSGWFPKSELIRRAHHKGCVSRDLAAELQGLVEAEMLAAHAVEWKAASGLRQRREFFLPLEEDG